MAPIRPSPITIMGIYNNSLPPEWEAEYDLFSPLGLLGIKFGAPHDDEVLKAATEAASNILGLKLCTEVLADTYYVMPVPPNGAVVQ